jgi:tetratricopeptide (TPR) repeat protein
MSKQKRERKQAPEKSQVAALGDSAARPQLSPGKKLAFGFVAFVLIPLLLVAGLELGLRLGGVGYPASYFRPLTIDGKRYLVENEQFGLRFFPRDVARSPVPLKMPAVKQPGVYRVFVFGESAAQGDPRPAYGAARYLEMLLAERFPTRRFEVVNTAMTAINSHAILPIARECADLEGDAWILYMGNNEMVGPFGATTVFGSRSPSIGYVRFSLALQRTRVGQLLFGLARRLAGGKNKQDPGWGGMRMFLESKVSPDAPRKEVVFGNYKRNLEDILRVGKSANVAILLNTVAVNLQDCAPFASEPKAGLSAADREKLEGLMKSAAQSRQASEFDAAAEAYAAAVKLGGPYAEAEYQLGKLLTRVPTNVPVAREWLQRATDHDALPFRADSRINGIVTLSAGGLPATSALVAAASVMASYSAPALPGANLFYEHVHFNFDGNYRLALAWAEQLAKVLPQDYFVGAAPQWASQEQCEQRLALTDWNRLGVLQNMMRRLSQPPFNGQSGHEQRMETYRAQAKVLRERMTPQAADAAREVYAKVIAKCPDDYRLHEGFAEFLEGIGRPQDAAQQWELVRALLPHHHHAYFQAGRLRLSASQLPEAEQRLREAVRMRPDLGEGWLLLGQISALQGKPGEALVLYEKAKALAPGDDRVHYHIGKALVALHRNQEGMLSFKEALRLRPDFWEARYALGEELAFAGNLNESAREFEAVIQANPSYPMAYLNLGVARFQQGNRAEAVRLFQETLRLDPKNERAAEYLRKLNSN